MLDIAERKGIYTRVFCTAFQPEKQVVIENSRLHEVSYRNESYSDANFSIKNKQTKQKQNKKKKKTQNKTKQNKTKTKTRK